jgi:N-acetylglucosamine malate deacetylase 2
MYRKILAVFAHPDDEAFGPGGTLAKYAHEGVEIQLLMVTRGEAGQIDEELKVKITNIHKNEFKLCEVREKEVLNSAKVLKINSVDFLNYRDGELRNNIYHELAGKIINKINEFKPQIVLTNERRGISGHLDHIAVSMITTYSFLKTSIPQKLYYNCISKKMTDLMQKQSFEYFVYFPEGYSEEEITTRIDYTKYWEKKVRAMNQHLSQIKDVKTILSRYKELPKVDNFILQYHRRVKTHLPETDLFSGI